MYLCWSVYRCRQFHPLIISILMHTLLFLSSEHLIIIALVVLLLFGGKKIPELMHGLGKGVKSFKDGMNDVGEEMKKEVKQDDKETDKK